MLEVREIGSVRGKVKADNCAAVPLLQAGKGVEIVKFHMKHGQILSKVPDHIISIYALGGKAFTALVDDEPIAAAGVILTSPGLGSAWGMISHRAKTMPFMLHRAVLRRLRTIIDENQLRRVDYVVDPLKPTAVHWAKRLGFNFEGTMKAFYEDGHSALMYAWIHPDWRRSDD